MNINQKEFIIQVKFGLNQWVSMEPEMFVPTTITGHMASYCNHLDENDNIKKVYKRDSTYLAAHNNNKRFFSRCC